MGNSLEAQELISLGLEHYGASGNGTSIFP